jgi:hypothetical protein
MKKLVLLLAVAFSVSMFSCGGSNADKVNQDSIDSVAKADSLAKAEAEAAAAQDSANMAADSANVAADSAAVQA